jgi:hypothetical protein
MVASASQTFAIRKWMGLGSFPNQFNTDFGPEKGVDLGGTYAVPGGDARVGWKPLPSDMKGLVDLARHFQPITDVCIYAVIYAKSPSARKAVLSAGSDDGIRKWDESCGDTWDPFWADDDCLYAFNCDGRGFGTKPRNLAFNRLSGAGTSGPLRGVPTFRAGAHQLAGSPVNSMDDYGVAIQKEADGATWKALGQECIDGVFYAFVSRHTYGHESGDPLLRQTAVNASLIKSTDRGLTWTRSAAENYRDPMWPGRAFGAPFFVHYGKDGGRLVTARTSSSTRRRRTGSGTAATGTSSGASSGRSFRPSTPPTGSTTQAATGRTPRTGPARWTPPPPSSTSRQCAARGRPPSCRRSAST